MMRLPLGPVASIGGGPPSGSPAINRFNSYRWRALDLERRKHAARCSDAAQRALFERVMRDEENTLDRAWAEVAAIAEGHSARAAELVAEHYLFGAGWHDVAAGAGIPFDRCKKICYRALRWLDAREG